MQNRNRYMADRSSVCVCFLTEREGGTAYTVKCAQKRGLEILNLAERIKRGANSLLVPTVTGQNVKFTRRDGGGIMRMYFRSEHFR